MSRIAFTSTIEEIVGKLAGSVFQDSYGGYQIRSRVSPRNPQTYYQQLRRGEFGYLSASWRFLTPPEVASWVAGAGTLPGAKRLFIARNINLTLINESPINTLPASAVPGAFPVDIQYWILSGLFFQAATSLVIVPAGQSLLIFATSEKEPPKNFTNPSMYSPIVSFPALTDLSAPVDISADWIARFGQFTAGQRICIKSCLIDTLTGNRGDDFISCAIEPFILVNTIIDSAGDTLVDFDATIISFP